MAYTVKKLAQLSGVSVRTLHFYDEIGLLKPAYIGDNHYRYYEQEQLLLLQQILFYRELGFSLNDVRAVLLSSNFDKIEALQSHRKLLKEKVDQTNKLIHTIDNTIAHLKGRKLMKDKEFYYGFDSEQQRKHERYLVESKIVTQELLDEANNKVKNWNDSAKNAFIQDIERIMQELVAKLEEGLAPHDAGVQDLISEHYQWICRSWEPTKQKYLDLRELYQSPEFRKFYDKRHPELLVFMLAAMTEFAERQL